MLLDLINSIPSRIYNVILAILMCIGVVYLYSYAGDISQEYATDKSKIELYIVTIAVVVFFFLSRFQSVFGQFLKALAYVLLGIFVVYMTAGLQDETALLIIRAVVGLTVAFGLYAFIKSASLQIKQEDLKKNGWKLDTKYKETILRPGDEENWYAIETVGRSPATGEELFFMSDELFSNPADKIVEGDLFTVYVDKRNPKKYYFDEKSLKDLY